MLFLERFFFRPVLRYRSFTLELGLSGLLQEFNTEAVLSS